MNKYTVIYPSGESLVIAASKHECFANNGVLTHCFATEDIIDTIIYGHIRISAAPIPPTKDEQLKASVKEIARLEGLLAAQKKITEDHESKYQALAKEINDREDSLAAAANKVWSRKDDFFNPKAELNGLLKHIINDKITRIYTHQSIILNTGIFACADGVTSARSVVVPCRTASYGQLGDKL